MGRPNLSREAEFSGANGDRGKLIFPVHLRSQAGLATVPVDVQFAIQNM